jgi:hypothetical protein
MGGYQIDRPMPPAKIYVPEQMLYPAIAFSRLSASYLVPSTSLIFSLVQITTGCVFNFQPIITTVLGCLFEALIARQGLILKGDL